MITDRASATLPTCHHGTVNDHLCTSLSLVSDFNAENAVHVSKGYGLGDISELTILKNAAGELLELVDSVAAGDGRELEELADTLACLFHFASRRGWALGEIDAEIVRKVSLRFRPAVAAECAPQ